MCSHRYDRCEGVETRDTTALFGTNDRGKDLDCHCPKMYGALR